MSYFIQTDVTLKWHENKGYYDMLARFVPYMAKKGWTLRFGLRPLVGDLRELTHIWEIPTLDGVTRVMDELITNPDPEVQEILAPMKNYCQNERTRLLIRTPYST
jgi:hypothetical protein